MEKIIQQKEEEEEDKRREEKRRRDEEDTIRMRNAKNAMNERARIKTQIEHDNNVENREETANLLKARIKNYPISDKNKKDFISSILYDEDEKLDDLYNRYMRGKVSAPNFYSSIAISNELSRARARAKQNAKQSTKQKQMEKTANANMVNLAKQKEFEDINKRIAKKAKQLLLGTGTKSRRKKGIKTRRYR